MTYEDYFRHRTVSDIMEEYGEQHDEWCSLEQPDLRRFTLPSDGYDISCKLFVPKHKKPVGIVVGVHGFAGDKESSVLTRLAETLCRHRYALVCFDFPAHGTSNAPDEALRLDHCKHDLLTVTAWAKKTYPDVSYGIFATSFGGYVTLLCAEDLKDFKKVLRAPAVTMAIALEQIVSPVTKEELLRNGAVCGFERKMHIPGAFYRDLLENTFSVPDEPLLVIHGTKDEIIPFAAVQEIASRYDTVKLVAVDGADHRFKRQGDLDHILSESVAWFCKS